MEDAPLHGQAQEEEPQRTEGVSPEHRPRLDRWGEADVEADPRGWIRL